MEEKEKELLEAKKRIEELQKQLEEKAKLEKEQLFSEALKKTKVKDEFHEFVKFKLNWDTTTDFESEINKLVKDNEYLVEKVTTGGTQKTVGQNSNEKDEKTIDYSAGIDPTSLKIIN